MTNLKSQRRIASRLMKRGKNGVWINPDQGYRVGLAVTREDISKLIHDGLLKPKKIQGTSKGRSRAEKFKRARGQRRGPGSRKGTANARFSFKTKWMNKIRAQRKYLKKLRDEGYITSTDYRKLYLQAKGNLFRNVRFLANYIRESGIAKKRIPEGR
ncbi:MAG: 50S ribosomal protein L19e [Candidatus Kariarchaeaceae archaeon]